MTRSLCNIGAPLFSYTPFQSSLFYSPIPRRFPSWDAPRRRARWVLYSPISGRECESERPRWRALRLVRVVVTCQVAMGYGRRLGRGFTERQRSWPTFGWWSQSGTDCATSHTALVFVFAFASVSSLIKIAPKDIRTETNRLINTSQRLLMNLTECPKIV